MLPLIKIGEQTIYTYPLMIGMALSLFYTLSDFYHQKSLRPLKSFTLFFIGLVFSSFLFAKFLFFLIQAQKLELADILFRGGGLVFYGGLVGGLFFIFCYGWLSKRTLEDFNFLLPGLCFAHALGRLGCFLAGCCYGKFCELPWAVHSRHPVQIYESLSVLFLGIFFLSAKRRSFKLYLFLYALIRFALEFLRGDNARGFWGIFSTSQVIALFFIFIAGFFLLKKRFARV